MLAFSPAVATASVSTTLAKFGFGDAVTVTLDDAAAVATVAGGTLTVAGGSGAFSTLVLFAVGGSFLPASVTISTSGVAAPAPAPAPAPVVGGVLNPVETFDGGVGDLAGLQVRFANNSTLSIRPRCDNTITGVPLGLFSLPDAFFIGEPPGCGGPGDRSIVYVGDEVAINRFTATFTNLNTGALIATFGEETVQAVSQEVFAPGDLVNPIGARQDVPWALWSVRFEDVAPLVPDQSLVMVRLDNTVLAQAVFTGDSAVNDATDVAETQLVDGALAAVEAPPAPQAGLPARQMATREVGIR